MKREEASVPNKRTADVDQTNGHSPNLRRVLFILYPKPQWEDKLGRGTLSWMSIKSTAELAIRSFVITSPCVYIYIVLAYACNRIIY